MVLMSEGLRKAAGPKLKSILESLTKRPLRGFVVGAGVTAVIQSSSATTVIIVGLVTAGLLTLQQAISVIIGSNVGTTATAWLVSASGLKFLDISLYSMPAVGLGFLLYLGGRSRRLKSIGEIMLGFGILFLGIEALKGAFTGLEDSPRVQELFVSLGHRPVWALLAGLGLTMLIQSSSASIAIVQLLAIGGAFGAEWTAALNAAIPFVLGANIGTTITAQLAALQANRNGKRTAWAHTMFNVLGSVMAFPFVYLGWYGRAVLAVCPWELTGQSVGATIAVAHSFFNIAASCIFLPLSPVLAKVALWLVPLRTTEASLPPVVLEKHLLNTPEIAIDQTRRQIVHMAKTAKRAFIQAIEGITQDNRKKLDAVKEIEDIVDSLQFEITSYLSALAARSLADGISVRLPVLLHAVNDLERVGDHAVNIMEIAQRKIDQKITFSPSADSEARMLRENAEQMFDDVIAAIETEDIQAARAALAIEKKLNEAQVELRRTHVARMSEGACSPQAGLIFIDLVDNVEKIGDHLTNIAQATIGGLHWEGIKPKLVHEL